MKKEIQRLYIHLYVSAPLSVSVPPNKVKKMAVILLVWNNSECYSLPHFRIIFGEIWSVLEISGHFSFSV